MIKGSPTWARRLAACLLVLGTDMRLDSWTRGHLRRYARPDVSLLRIFIGIFMVAICQAELKTNEGFSLDWSYAGVGAGEGRTAYRPSRRCNIQDYGAAMDGTSNDQDAIQAAIDDCGRSGGGVVKIPSGTVRLEGQVRIGYSNVVLKGAGKDRTTVYIPHSLKYYDLAAGKDDDGKYSKSNAFLEIRGTREPSDSEFLGTVILASPPGSNELYMDDTMGIFPGQWIILMMSDPKYGPLEGSIVGRMYSNPDPNAQCNESCLQGLRGTKNMIRFMSRVESVVDENLITLTRKLPLGVEPNWRPRVYSILDDDRIQDSGIEDLTVEFGWKRAKAHLNEDGHNGVILQETIFCWVKNVAVINADLNILVRRSNFVTVTGVDARITKDRSYRRRTNRQGHIAFAIHDSSDIEVSDFNVEEKWYHDLSTRNSQLSVFRQGRGKDVNMDLHRFAPYMILYEDIDLGKGGRPFTSGGKDASGLPSAGYSTFSNIRTSTGESIALPGCKYGPNLNFFGEFKRRKNLRRCKGWTVSDSINRGALYGN